MREFLRDFTLPIHSVARHDPRSLEVLAQLSGLPLSDLLRWSFSKRNNFLGGHELTPLAVRKDSICACSVCLREDIDTSEGPVSQRVSIRGDWQISALSVCFIHNVSLVPVWHGSSVASKVLFDDQFHDIHKLLHTGALDRAIQTPTKFELWFEHQLEGKDEAGWLGTFSLFEAADFCLWIGQLVSALEGGSKDWFPDIVAYDRGFSIASGGKENVHSFLRDIQLFYSPSSDRTRVLGRLSSSFLDTTNIRLRPKIANFVREHIVRFWALGPGDKCLFEPVENRHIHSLTSAARTLGVKPTEAKGMLSLVDHTPCYAEERMNAIDQFSLEHVAAAKRIADRMVAEAERAAAKLVSTQVVQSTFGIPQKDFRAMWRDGLLKPVSGQTGESRWCLEEIDRFFCGMEKNIVKVVDRPQDPGWMAISELCLYCRIKPSEVFKYIQEGQFLDIVVLRNMKRYEAIRIKPSREWLWVLGVGVGELTAFQFAKSIQVQLPAAYTIAYGGLIRFHLKRLPTEMRPRMLISCRDLKRFQGEYVSEAEIGALTGESRQSLAKYLNRVCVTVKGAVQTRSLPLFEWAEVEAKLFCRWPRGNSLE